MHMNRHFSSFGSQRRIEFLSVSMSLPPCTLPCIYPTLQQCVSALQLPLTVHFWVFASFTKFQAREDCCRVWEPTLHRFLEKSEKCQLHTVLYANLKKKASQHCVLCSVQCYLFVNCTVTKKSGEGYEVAWIQPKLLKVIILPLLFLTKRRIKTTQKLLQVQ